MWKQRVTWCSGWTGFSRCDRRGAQASRRKHFHSTRTHYSVLSPRHALVGGTPTGATETVAYPFSIASLPIGEVEEYDVRRVADWSVMACEAQRARSSVHAKHRDIVRALV